MAQGVQIRKDIEHSIFQKQLEMKAIRDEMAAETTEGIRLGIKEDDSGEEKDD